MQPIVALGQQRRGLDFVPLQRQQCIADRLRESDQGQRFIAGLVLRFIEDDLNGTGHGLDALAGDRMARGADDSALIILQGQVVSARTLERQREAFVGGHQLALAGALVFQTHPAITARRDGFALLAATFIQITERDLVAHRTETLGRA
ncbi:hypothetical protein D3C87_1715780 [compost metagenome]